MKMEKIDTEFSSRLRYAMQYSGLRATDLSELTGLSRATISEYLKGRYVPKQKNMGDLAKALHVQPTFLMGLTDFKPTRAPSYVKNEDVVSLNPQERLMLTRYRALTDAQRLTVDELLRGLVPYDPARKAAHDRLDAELDAKEKEGSSTSRDSNVEEKRA